MRPLEVRPELRNGSTALHGGVLMGLPTRSRQMTCAFLNLPAALALRRLMRRVASQPHHRRLRDCHATCHLGVGRTLIILEVEVRDDHGKLAVKTSQTQIVLNR